MAKQTPKFSPDELEDIQASYRDAADREQQIGILAELYAVKKADICKALGVPVPEEKPKHRKYSQETREAVVRAVLIDGMTHKEAGEKYGVLKGTVHFWVQRAQREV